jgi:hypothetical protein
MKTAAAWLLAPSKATVPQELQNLTVATLEHRYAKEFSALFERLGATVQTCPLLEEKPVENREELQEFVRHVIGGSLDLMIFLTGVGARFLVAESESMGVKQDFIAALGRLTIVVRGPKPVTALRQLGVHIDVIPDNPTSEGVIEALRNRDLQGNFTSINRAAEAMTLFADICAAIFPGVHVGRQRVDGLFQMFKAMPWPDFLSDTNTGK